MQSLTSFDQIATAISDFIGACGVIRRNFSGRGLVVIGAEYRWEPLTPDRQVEQISIRRAYNSWFSNFSSVLPELPNTVRHDVEQADNFIRSWIEQSVTLATEPEPDAEKNRHEISAQLTVLRNAALLLERAGIPLFDSGETLKSSTDRPDLPSSIRSQDSADTGVSDIPKAFISYAWESDEHQAWVRGLASRLRANGVDVRLDQWHLAHGDQLPSFMEREVRDNDFVLIICTPKYRERSNARAGGVGYEGDVMTSEVCVEGNHRKFIPVLRAGRWTEAAPSWLRGKRYVDLTGTSYNEMQYEELLRTLHRAHEEPPPVGTRPDFR